MPRMEQLFFIASIELELEAEQKALDKIKEK